MFSSKVVLIRLSRKKNPLFIVQSSYNQLKTLWSTSRKNLFTSVLKDILH